MPTTEQKTPGSELTPMKFSRLTRRGVLLGLSVAQLVTLGIGGLALLAAFYGGAGMLLAYTAPVWLLAMVLTWVPVAGRPMVEWLPVALWWLWRSTGGQLLYRRRIVKPRPAGNLALPGDMARQHPRVGGGGAGVDQRQPRSGQGPHAPHAQDQGVAVAAADQDDIVGQGQGRAVHDVRARFPEGRCHAGRPARPARRMLG